MQLRERVRLNSLLLVTCIFFTKVRFLYIFGLKRVHERNGLGVDCAPTNTFVRFFGQNTLIVLSEKHTSKDYIFALIINQNCNYDGNFTENPKGHHFLASHGG